MNTQKNIKFISCNISKKNIKCKHLKCIQKKGILYPCNNNVVTIGSKQINFCNMCYQYIIECNKEGALIRIGKCESSLHSSLKCKHFHQQIETIIFCHPNDIKWRCYHCIQCILYICKTILQNNSENLIK